MTQLPSLFDLNKFDPFSIGFSKVFDDLQKAAKNLPSYPPYNIKQVKDNKYVIEMAVAGFAKSDIEITLNGDTLVVSGSAQDDASENESYVWKGIANRNFTRSFKLADKIEIKDAEIANGMLKIWLENMVKAQDAIKKISINEK